jgi:hypothetical protein
LKVVPDAFAADPERLARFEREAQILASLNHPNIAIIHGLEEADGVKALVMELVEGATLADRLARGPLPIDESHSAGDRVDAADRRAVADADRDAGGTGVALFETKAAAGDSRHETGNRRRRQETEGSAP